MSKTTAVSFRDFVNRFEEVTLPIAIGTDTHLDFSSLHDPLPLPIVEKFLIENHILEVVDEFTEVVPVMKIPETGDFYAVIIWTAALLEYDYWLLTFDKSGLLLDSKRIAGTRVANNLISHTVVTITEQWEVHIVEGERVAEKEDDFEATQSRRLQFQIFEDGSIQEEEPDFLL